MIKNAFRQFRSNLGAFVLALLLAFVIWIAAGLQTDPFADRRYPNVPVTLLNQPENTVFLEAPVEQVVVTARARESVLAELRVASFQATLDLSEVEPGAPAPVPIVVACSNDQVRLEAVDPQGQTVYLAMVETLTLPVTILVQGQVAMGYETGDVTASPAQVTVRGPAPSLPEVASVTGSVDVDGARKTASTMVSLKPLDASGRLVAGVELEPDQVQVEVPVRSLAEYKPDVSVAAIVRGDPAPGYRKGEVTVRPASVTLEGPARVLDSLPDFVETLPITISGATESLLRQSLLAVPNDVNVVEVSYVTVTVEILPILGTRTLTGTVEMLRVPAGMRATPIPDVVTVTLEGPDAKLSALRPEDLLIVLDLRGYLPGMHRVKPDVLVPAGVTVLSVDPETVALIIEPVPTPAPTPAPTPTPTAKPKP